MMYLAPRQGLFAIIVLISFCLQTLLLVISTDQQLSKSRAIKGEQMVAQLIDESRLSLENKDRVSLSVIANRYTSEQDVARIVIKDNSEELLVPVGNAPMQQGDTIRRVATNGDAVIGSVALTLKDISKGEIIAMQWPFIIGSMFSHLFLWLLYGYIARPTKEQINALSHDIEDIHRERYLQAGQHSRQRGSMRHEGLDDDIENTANITDYETRHSDGRLHGSDDVRNNAADKGSANPANMNAPVIQTSSIHDDLNAYVKSQQDQSTANDTEMNPNDKPEGNQAVTTNDRADHDNNKANVSDSIHKATALSATRPLDKVSVQIAFHDKHNMLGRLAPETRLPYIALCNQLLNQAVHELLKQPLLLGVSATNQPRFTEAGANIELQADNSHAKVALAGVMLGKLYLMLNKIIHDKHKELSRFALPAKAGVSDEAQVEAMTQLLESVGDKEQMLILLPQTGIKQISHYAQLQHLQRPTTVYERECTIFDGGSDAMMQRLADVRNAVLMVEHEKSR